MNASTQLLEKIEGPLRMATSYVTKLDHLYASAPSGSRRLMNQFMFEKLLVADEGIAGAIYREPWSSVLTSEFRDRADRSASGQEGSFSGPSSKVEHLVDQRRFELLTTRTLTYGVQVIDSSFSRCTLAISSPRLSRQQ